MRADRQAQAGRQEGRPSDFQPISSGRNEHFFFLPLGTLNGRRSLQCTKRAARRIPPHRRTDCTMGRASGVVSPKEGEAENDAQNRGKQKTTTPPPPPPTPIRLGREEEGRGTTSARARLGIHTSSSSALPSFLPSSPIATVLK